MEVPKLKAAAKTFKTWTKADFRSECEAANHDGILTPVELDDFIAYWQEASTTGRTRRQMEKTWDTRRRMRTAVQMIYSQRRRTGPASAPGEKVINGSIHHTKVVL